MSIKRRIEKLELHKANKDLGLMLLEQLEDDLFIEWGNDEGASYTGKEVSDIQKDKQVLIIKWV